jgi:hypothetical protein
MTMNIFTPRVNVEITLSCSIFTDMHTEMG